MPTCYARFSGTTLGALLLFTGLAAAQQAAPPPAAGADAVPERVAPPRPDSATIPPTGTPGAEVPLPPRSPDPGVVAPTPSPAPGSAPPAPLPGLPGGPPATRG